MIAMIPKLRRPSRNVSLTLRLGLPLGLCLFLFFAAFLHAQDQNQDQRQDQQQNQQPDQDQSVRTEPPIVEQNEATPDDTLTTMFPHPEWNRIWLSGQANFISQYHPAFHSPYQGKNSLSPQAQDATSRVLTLFTGLRLTDSTEFLCDVQETGGNGLGQALGVAGFFNLDVVRNPSLSKAPYVARLMWHQVIPLGSRRITAERSPFSVFSELPERRLELRFGKMSMADFFDLNTYGTDSNFQFMNWELLSVP